VNTALQRKAAEDLDELYDEVAEQEALAILLEPRYTGMLAAVHELVAATFPAMENFRLDDEATRRMLEHAAKQVVRIDETTREELRALLKIGQERGYSAWEIANGVPKDDFPGIEGLFKETWKGRAATVARNELLEAQHTATMDRYRVTGLVDRIRIRDGRDDGPCADRDGTVVSMASNPARLHVNCTLVVIPILRGEPS
jgi:hypothetical protein